MWGQRNKNRDLHRNDAATFSLQLGSELERTVLADQLIRNYGESLMKDSRRLDTLVNVLEFFYTQWSGEGAGTISRQVKLGERRFVLELVSESVNEKLSR